MSKISNKGKITIDVYGVTCPNRYERCRDFWGKNLNRMCAKLGDTYEKVMFIDTQAARKDLGYDAQVFVVVPDIWDKNDFEVMAEARAIVHFVFGGVIYETFHVCAHFDDCLSVVATRVKELVSYLQKIVSFYEKCGVTPEDIDRFLDLKSDATMGLCDRETCWGKAEENAHLHRARYSSKFDYEN